MALNDQDVDVDDGDIGEEDQYDHKYDSRPSTFRPSQESPRPQVIILLPQ